MSYNLADAAKACGPNKSTVLRAIKGGKVETAPSSATVCCSRRTVKLLSDLRPFGSLLRCPVIGVDAFMRSLTLISNGTTEFVRCSCSPMACPLEPKAYTGSKSVSPERLPSGAVRALNKQKVEIGRVRSENAPAGGPASLLPSC